MADREVIDSAFENLTEEELQTDKEAAAEPGSISNPIPLTADLVVQVLAKLRAGTSVREIKKTVFVTGRDGEKLKLTFPQIQEIAERRRYYYNRLRNAGVIE
jgi:hypothetical protein